VSGIFQRDELATTRKWDRIIERRLSSVLSAAVPEHYQILRALQFVARTIGSDQKYFASWLCCWCHGDLLDAASMFWIWQDRDQNTPCILV
jgi:hypothetical protein